MSTARAIWKGLLELASLHVAVKLHAAAIDRAVHFRLLHAKDGQPLGQRLISPRTGREVPPDEVRKSRQS